MSGFQSKRMMAMGRQHGKSYVSQMYKRLMDDLQNMPVEELILSEGTIYGSRYHTVQPVGGNWMNMELWCMETFGGPGDKMWGEPQAPEPLHRWYMNNRKFWFKDIKDRDWFILRWNS